MLFPIRSLAAPILLVACLSACGAESNASEGEGASGSTRTERPFPPRTGANDALAEGLVGSTLELRIDGEMPLTYAGDQDLESGQFIPVEGSFEVSGGDLVSTVGSIEKRASFGGWSPISDDEGNRIGYGFDLTAGELLLPTVFLQEPPEGLRVTNVYAAVDFGAEYTLITLDPSLGHRLTVQYLNPDGAGMFGALRASVKRATVSGLVLLTPRASLLSSAEVEEGTSFLAITASCTGTRIEFPSETWERGPDGWHGVDSHAR